MSVYYETDYYTCNFCDKDVYMTMLGTVEDNHLVATGTCPECTTEVVLEVEHYLEADPDIDHKRSLGED